MSKNITESELKRLLAKEPDTELKKKLLAMMEPEVTDLDHFHANAQHVVDLMAESLGKKKIFLKKGCKSYVPHFGVRFKSGKFYAGFYASFDFQDQQRIEINHISGGYSAVEIRVDKDNPRTAIDLMLMAVGRLNGDQND
ncbi:hypothetical protein BHG00_09880 [Corynebacterium ulcerans]|uniref:hypothetical protein n=1 Tax=Corynebacterium ulcerans TaxID=65058 RepID=UPI0008FB83F6|nr:hypothetical protein [Corynebacterium ulcerans]MBH5301434.1 hypothetical protein [Corynebacterium ulcerans]OIS05329.1 hypothetical protein BHG00_09880 [Corynebacterium ulcerans]